ncbi:MAG: hypothetical protein AAF849_15790 [Bacteroidota bacterium]
MLVNVDFENIRAKAKARAEVMVKNGLYSRFRLSDSQRIDKALLGCIGELAFEQFLIQRNVPYKLDETDFESKNSDEYDFLISGKKIDVKVAKKSTPRPPSDGWTYGYPEEQNPQLKDYVVVGWVDFSKEEVGFYGWITGIQISTYKVVTHNSFAGYRYLTPNHEFRWGAMNKRFDELLNELSG